MEGIEHGLFNVGLSSVFTWRTGGKTRQTQQLFILFFGFSVKCKLVLFYFLPYKSRQHVLSKRQQCD